MCVEHFNGLKERAGKPDIRTMPRVMKRLQKEAVKAKDILSANKKINLKIGELADYVSLTLTIDRKDLEEKA
jgi:molecular chaperone DnaK (HSP70)